MITEQNRHLTLRNHPLLNHFIHQYNIHQQFGSDDDSLHQHHHDEGLVVHHHLNSDGQQEQLIDSCFSCLSPVSKLVHKGDDNESTTLNHYEFIDPNTGLLLIDNENNGNSGDIGGGFFQHFIILPPEKEDEQSSSESSNLDNFFLQASLKLREICKVVWKVHALDSILLTTGEPQQLLSNKDLIEHLTVTKQPLDLLEYLQRIVQQDDSFSNIYSVFSLLSTMVEHLITSIVYTVATLDESKSSNDIVIPLTLTEILECVQVKKVLPLKLLNVIKVFMGPPKGLNLRNVLYHGFLDETEIHPSYLSFLWRIYLTTCKCISNYTRNSSGWNEFILKPRTDMSASESSLTTTSQFDDILQYQQGILLYQNESDEKLIENILTDNYFIIPTRMRIIRKAFEFLRRGLSQSNQVDLQLSLCLLFPQFEFCLRRVYVCGNQKVDERTWSAQNEEFFSTLDVIFSNHLETSIYSDTILSNDATKKIVTEYHNLTPNELFNMVGNNIGDALMDAFMFYRGPRLRDKIAHCQVLCQIDPKLVQHFFLIFLSLCVHFSIKKKKNTSGDDDHHHSQTISSSSEESNSGCSQEVLLLTSTMNHFIHKQVSFSAYDIRTRFINFWNEVRDVYYQQNKFYCCGGDGGNYVCQNPVGYLKEFDEYKCAINRDGFSLQKSLDEAIRNDLISILESNFKKGQPKNVQFSMNECFEYLTCKYPLVGTKIQSQPIECIMYNNHFYCAAQQITNIEMLVRVLEHLYTGLEALEEKYLDLCNLINERKARTPHRKLFIVMTQTRSILDFMFKFFIEYTFVQFDIIDKRQVEEGDGKKRLNWVQQLLTQALRIESQIKEGTVGVMCAKFLEFLIQKEKIIEKDLQDFNYIQRRI